MTGVQTCALPISALERTARVIGERPVTTDVEDAPLVKYDSVLLQQALVNLLENAAKHTPGGTPIAISAREVAEGVEVVVADRGPGLARGKEADVWGELRRGRLGLTIAKAIVVAHGGRIWAENRDGGGAAFHFTLPMDGIPPATEPEP